MRVVRKVETDEWLVKVWLNGVYSEDATYYTDDKSDAVSTMSLMAFKLRCQGFETKEA